MNREIWEQKKQKNREADKKAKRVFTLDPKFRKEGFVVRTISGVAYRIAPDGSWRRKQ